MHTAPPSVMDVFMWTMVCYGVSGSQVYYFDCFDRLACTVNSA